MTPPDDKTQKRLIVDQVLAPNSNASAVEQMLLVAEISVFKGKYEFLGIIGSGGMGVVYKAREIMLDRLVAIKMLNAAGLSVQDLRRFQQEAKAATKLIHPNLIAIRDFGVTAEGQPYMAFDFIEGQTLAEIIKKRGQLEIEKALDIIIQALRGLSHAHQRGVLHRDIKPSNIIISEGYREVKIVDFGIAKVIDEETTQRLTQTGEIFGTPLYMSPEQGAGKKLDARSDLYSMGCVMFEALTAVPPLVGESSINTIIKHQNEDPPSLKEASLGKDFPLSLEKSVAKLLAKNPDKRYQTAKELMDDLIEIKASLSAAPAKPVPLAKAPAHRFSFSFNPISILITGISIALAIALFSVVKLSLQTQHAHDNAHYESMIYELAKRVTGLDYSGPEPKITGQFITGLSHYPQLSKLNLHEAYLEGHPLSQLGPQITDIDLSKSNVTDDDFANLPVFGEEIMAASFKGKVKKINLDDTRVSNKTLDCLQQFVDLQDLSLNHTDVTDIGLHQLGDTDSEHSRGQRVLQPREDRISKLRSLQLRGDQISDRGLKYLKEFPRLEELDLQFVKGPITETGISYLSQCKALRKISISDSKLLKPLAHISQLHEILIRSSNVTANDLLELRELPNLISLNICAKITRADYNLVEHSFEGICKIEFDTEEESHD